MSAPAKVTERQPRQQLIVSNVRVRRDASLAEIIKQLDEERAEKNTIGFNSSI